jgi:hypothetical protein
MNIGELTLIRKLNIQELFLDYSVRKKYQIFVNAFLIDSKYDLFKDVDKVDRAIEFWKSTHPFLRCKIYTKYNEESEPDAFEKFFFYVDSEETKVPNDVLYLDFRANGDVGKLDYWKYLFEREFTVAVDQFFNHLWTLKIIKLGDCVDMKYKYCFLFNINHSVSDNLNAYALINELCHYIDQAEHECLPNEVDDRLLKLFRFEFDYPNDVREVKVIDECASVDETIGRKIPNYFMPTIQNNFGEIVDVDPTHWDGAFYSIDKTKYLSVHEIIEESRTNYVTKYCFSTFPKESFLKLRAKANENNVKLSTCFSLITAFALRNIYRLFSNDMNLNEIIDYSESVSIRKYIDPPLDPRVIGSWFLLKSFKFEEEFDEKNEKFWSETFWKIANKASLSNDQVKFSENELRKYFKNLSFLFNKIVNGLKFDGFIGHFCLNYMEELNDVESNSNVCIREHRKGVGFEKFLTYNSYSSHNLSTINDTLFWDMTYSSYLMNKQVAECWMDNISEIYFKII